MKKFKEFNEVSSYYNNEVEKLSEVAEYFGKKQLKKIRNLIAKLYFADYWRFVGLNKQVKITWASQRSLKKANKMDAKKVIETEKKSAMIKTIEKRKKKKKRKKKGWFLKNVYNLSHPPAFNRREKALNVVFVPLSAVTELKKEVVMEVKEGVKNE